MSEESANALPPLAGIRVLEAAEYVAAPFATLALADLGADVVKVERPGRGDSFRSFGLKRDGVSAFWLNTNRGKRSIVLDLKDTDDQQQFLRLAAAADVFVHNNRPGVLDGLGLGDDVLVSANPRLIRAHVCGYGPSGPRSGDAVYDSVIQAASGLAAAQGRGGEPQMMVPMVIDKVTALTLTQAILAALVARSRDGLGRRVEVAMLDAAAYWNFADLLQDHTFVDDDRRLAPARSQMVRTADGHVVINPVTGREIGRTLDAVGHPEWKSDLKEITDPSLLLDTLFTRVESATEVMSTDDVVAALRAHDVAGSAVLNVDAHLADEQVAHNEIYTIVDDVRVGRVRTVRHPARYDGGAQAAAFHNPRPDDDRDAVLREWTT